MSDGKSMGAVQIGATAPSGSSVVSQIDKDLAHRLNHILHLGFDLRAAYRVALERIEDDRLREHLRHIDESHHSFFEGLAVCVSDLGHTPTHSGDLHGLLERGRVILGELAGDDGIVSAMADNEEELSTGIREALSHTGLPKVVEEALEALLRHEALHRSFYNDRLGRFVG